MGTGDRQGTREAHTADLSAPLHHSPTGATAARVSRTAQGAPAATAAAIDPHSSPLKADRPQRWRAAGGPRGASSGQARRTARLPAVRVGHGRGGSAAGSGASRAEGST